MIDFRITGCIAASLALMVLMLIGMPAPDPARAQGTATIVALGDSLISGFGLEPREAFPAQLERALRKRGHDVTVLNAGVPGETAAEGLARLDRSVPEGTRAVIVELGANDALQGVDPSETKAALSAIVTRLAARRIAVLLTGMIVPPALNEAYAKAFNAIYAEVAQAHDVLLHPYFLEGVADNDRLLQRDGLHPNAVGVVVIIESILPEVEQLLARAGVK